MHGELNLHGVFLPTLLLLMALAWLLKGAAAVGLSRLGAYRHVWHPALFNTALYILLLGALFLIARWIQP